MRRREFIGLVGIGVAAPHFWPFSADAQQGERVRLIGVLLQATKNDLESEARVKAFLHGLEQLGWTEGRNLKLEYRWAGGNSDDIRKHAKIQRVEDIAPAIEALKTRADALYVATDPVVLANRVRTNALARGARLPTIYGGREYVEAGALMSCGPSWPHLFRRAAEYVDKILRGAKLGDIPVEQPTKFRTGHQSWHRKGARHCLPEVIE